ncbi:hypothetical protein Tco_0516168 [Tanacetum coccineum]
MLLGPRKVCQIRLASSGLRQHGTELSFGPLWSWIVLLGLGPCMVPGSLPIFAIFRDCVSPLTVLFTLLGEMWVTWPLRGLSPSD